MLPPDLIPILVALLAAVSALALLVAVFYPRLSKNAEGHKRLTVLSASKGGGRSAQAGDAKRKDIEQTLRELEEKHQAAKGRKPSLLVRMRQAGLGWSKGTYYACCAATALGAFLAVMSTTSSGPLPALGFGVTAGLAGPHLYVGFLRSRRFKKFLKDFPNAIDVIVRGVKSGLPAIDCLRIVSVEAAEPVRSEFKEIVEDQVLGLPVDQAVQRLPTRIPLAEAKFFAIVVSLQSRTGGSLADSLGGLSKVVRDRHKFQAKVRAMSAEAKTSAGIIAALPVTVLFLMHLTSPTYIDLMFTTFAGNVLLAGCLVWMLIGVLVMWRMIRFDF